MDVFVGDGVSDGVGVRVTVGVSVGDGVSDVVGVRVIVGVSVGDGVNDAVALKEANVGIAMGGGSDIAIEAGDIVLAKGNLTGVVEAIKLSNATFRKIKQNLFWAFFYNVVAIPLAVAGFLNPVVAEIAMALSSITVVTNANLLRFSFNS